MDFWAYSLGMQLFTRVPHLLVWGAAIALAATRLNVHPTASRLLLVGASLSLFVTLFGAGLAVLPLYLVKQGRSPTDAGVLTGVLGGGTTLLSAIGLAFVVASVFVDRQPSRKTGA